MPLSHLTRPPPFNLDPAGVDWVQRTVDGLTLRDTLAQLFVLINMGDDPADPEQIRAFQAHGLAATAKHWPGEGFDDRDQHLVTTVNPRSMPDWEVQFGTLYRAAINAGVLSVMSAHIALPAFIRELDPNAEIEAFRPASVSHALNIDLLRGRLGFNGVIVSDAVGSGRITQARLHDAVSRVLGLKAALGLHVGRGLPQPDGLAQLGRAENHKIAAQTFREAPTLVKDTQNLLPLNPATHRRVLVIPGGIISPIHPPAAFVLPDLLAARGFAVTLFEKGSRVNPTDFDLVLYLFGEETLLTRSRIFTDIH